jgi:aspartate ammonia-lyase
VFEPVIAACVFEAQTMFITRRIRCGFTASTASPPTPSVAHYVDYSIGTVTALNPVIGYDRSTELAAEAMKTGRGIMELVREKHILTEQQINEVLDPVAMTGQARR